MKTFALWAMLAAGAVLEAGCASRNPDEAPLTWSRPAEWENRIPGLMI